MILLHVCDIRQCKRNWFESDSVSRIIIIDKYFFKYCYSQLDTPTVIFSLWIIKRWWSICCDVYVYIFKTTELMSVFFTRYVIVKFTDRQNNTYIMHFLSGYLIYRVFFEDLLTICNIYIVENIHWVHQFMFFVYTSTLYTRIKLLLFPRNINVIIKNTVITILLSLFSKIFFYCFLTDFIFQLFDLLFLLTSWFLWFLFNKKK